MSRAAPRLVFHVGAEKTGTTSFQRFCSDSRMELLKRGLLYPTASHAFSKTSYNHAPLVASYLLGEVAPDMTVARVWRSRENLLKPLFDEIGRTAGVETILISAEHFSSRFAGQHASRLRVDFAHFDPQIVIVLRPHLQRIYSLYSSLIKNGGCTRYDDYVRFLLGNGQLSVAYRTVLDTWATAFGRAKVHVLRLQEGEDCTDLLTSGGVIPAFPRPSLARYRDNVGENPCVVELLRQANGMIETEAPRKADTFFRRSLTNRARGKILRRIHDAGSDPLTESWARSNLLRCSDPDLQTALELGVAKDEDWLRETWGVDLAPSSSDARLGAPTIAEIEDYSALRFNKLRLADYRWFKVALAARGRLRLRAG